MKKNILLTTIVAITLFSGCSQKNITNANREVTKANSKVDRFNKKIEKTSTTITSVKGTIEATKDTIKDTDLAVEIAPDPDKDKVKVITKVKPEVKVVDVKKVDENEEPLVVVDPVEDAPVEKIEVNPVVDDTLGIVTEAKPTIGVVEELPAEDSPPAIVVDPVVIED